MCKTHWDCSLKEQLWGTPPAQNAKSGKSKPLEAEEEGAEEQLATSGGVLDLLFKGIFI